MVFGIDFQTYLISNFHYGASTRAARGQGCPIKGQQLTRFPQGTRDSSYFIIAVWDHFNLHAVDGGVGDADLGAAGRRPSQ